MICYHERIEKQVHGAGILLQILGNSENMNVLHWNLSDQSTFPPHHHPEEQFGYVIKGGLEAVIGEETATLKAGDCYFIPANVPHQFMAIGDTEVIDVWSPVRLPKKRLLNSTTMVQVTPNLRRSRRRCDK
jgi:quercetin dioxygenase-like cupin family protein